VTSWQGSRFSGDPDALGDAGADAVGAGVADGDAGADVTGAGGSRSGVGDAGALDDGAGAVDAGAIAVADSFGSVVTLLLLDDLHEVMSKAGVMTTRMSAARRCISGVSINVVLCRRSKRLKMKSRGCASVGEYVETDLGGSTFGSARLGSQWVSGIQQVLSDVSCGVQQPVGKWMQHHPTTRSLT
jgi:hypothetical protein